MEYLYSMNKIKSFIKDNKYNLILILIYCVVVFITMSYHELSNDECYPWTIVRQDTLSDVINTIRFDGHAFLWYFLILPFAKPDFPVISIQITAALVMISAVCFFLLKSPFNIFFKSIFIFSAGMLYFYPVMARNYSLIPLFVFLLAYLYPKRHNMPIVYSLLIIMLFQTHPYIGGFCLILSLMFIFECIENIVFKKSLYDCVSPVV